MFEKIAVALTAVATIGFSAASLAAGNKEAGQAKSATCVACHGVDGNSVNPEWPSLAGQHSTYIVRQLKAFKAGQRENVLMSPMAAILTEQDMEDLAAYFSSQTLRGGEADPSKVKLGQKLYRGGNLEKNLAACASCHGPNGRGILGAGWPSIQGQHALYVSNQLRAYRSGTRASDPNQMMRNVAALLSDEEIDAVASYVQGLR
jgi:cytochrome c553